MNAEPGLLDENSIQRIHNSFRYFGMSLSTTGDESRFLHAWIALEYLLKDGSRGSIISPITEHIPKMLSLQYTIKLIRDLGSNFKRFKLNSASLKGIGVNVLPSGHFSGKDLFAVLSKNASVSALAGLCTNPLLKQRIINLGEIFCDAKKLQTALYQHLEDIKWHLQRMYRVRNRIAHSAAVEFDLRQLMSNLDYYYSTTIDNILYYFGGLRDRKTLNEIFMHHSATYDYIEESLNKGSVPQEIIPRF